MNNSGVTSENIQLSLPINPAYVSAARLTASSIANRMLFDIDEVEAVKVAVSEACTFVIRSLPQNVSSDFTIVFAIKKDVLTITIATDVDVPASTAHEEMGLVMIRALMDEFNIYNSVGSHFKIEMIKKHKEISFS